MLNEELLPSIVTWYQGTVLPSIWKKYDGVNKWMLCTLLQEKQNLEKRNMLMQFMQICNISRKNENRSNCAIKWKYICNLSSWQEKQMNIIEAHTQLTWTNITNLGMHNQIRVIYFTQFSHFGIAVWLLIWFVPVLVNCIIDFSLSSC